jgi:tetratricopeptide (TPR) repeat protein
MTHQEAKAIFRGYLGQFAWVVAVAYSATGLWATSVALAAAPPDVDYAQQLYAAGQTDRALKAAQSAINTQPTNERAHYLKANCLVKLGRLKEALYEYSMAERLLPGSNLAMYCRDARMRLTSSTTRPKEVEQRGWSAKVPLVNKSEEDETTDQEATAPSPTNAKTKSLPPGTIELIRKQAGLARQHALDVGAAEAENELQKANNQVAALRERAEKMAAGGAAHEPVALSPPDAAAIRARAMAGSEQLKQMGQLKASIKEWESQEKANEIQQQAENLQRRLLDDSPEKEGAVKINPVGTNLYIRNYSTVPITPLRAEARDLFGRSKSTAASGTRSGTASGLADQATQGRLMTSKPIETKSNTVNTVSADRTARPARESLNSVRHSVTSVKGQVIHE